MPLTNINKFGLMHYSIPKTLDMVDATNNTFILRIHYKTEEVQDVRVYLPVMDYYTMRVETDERGGEYCRPGETYLTEVLQTAINWAIQKHGVSAQITSGPGHVNRVGCVVKLGAEGRLEFYFGYRGNVHTVTQEDIDKNLYDKDFLDQEIVKKNSGNPMPFTSELQKQDFPAHPAVQGVANDNTYSWIDPEGVPVTTTFDRGQLTETFFRSTFQLTAVEFINMPLRMQMILGADGDSAGGNDLPTENQVNPSTGGKMEHRVRTVRRGRVCLVNYENRPLLGLDPLLIYTNIVRMTMPKKPNIHAPSMIFMDLTTQGTKTKVLGHTAERGGWAVPCDASEFYSSYKSYPWLFGNTDIDQCKYDVLQVRNMPCLINAEVPVLANEAALGRKADQANNVPAIPPIYYAGTAENPACKFDQVARHPQDVVFTDANDGDREYLNENNYSLVRQPDNAGNANPDKNYKFGSRFVTYGSITGRFPRAPYVADARQKFGPRHQMEAGVTPAFTVSMITPQWIFTDVPNSTVQTLDVQLMWGDTSENIYADTAVPTQLSLIASQ